MISCIEVQESLHNADVTHEDVNPQNFMIENNELHLIDFGLASRQKSTPMIRFFFFEKSDSRIFILRNFSFIFDI